MKSLRKIPQKWPFWNLCFRKIILLLGVIFCSLSCGSEGKKKASSSEELQKEERSKEENQIKADFANFEDEIKINEPIPGETVSSPVIIKGKARGSWFFEATAPVELVSGKGEILAHGYITAIGDWMTEDFVPFKAEISFPLPKTETGYLIMRNANPSSLPEHDRKIEIPVKFLD